MLQALYKNDKLHHALSQTVSSRVVLTARESSLL